MELNGEFVGEAVETLSLLFFQTVLSKYLFIFSHQSIYAFTITKEIHTPLQIKHTNKEFAARTSILCLKQL